MFVANSRNEQPQSSAQQEPSRLSKANGPSGRSDCSDSASKTTERRVQHNYHDHMHDKPPAYLYDEVLGNGHCFMVSSSGLGGAGLSFTIKLHEMLNSVEKENLQHIVSWQPHGRCFVVHKVEGFKELLPRFFGISKIASFQRQLNMYGFQRITQGMDKGGYYHELFLRGRVFLAYQIRRVRIKGKGARAKANPEQEPNFWNMPWLPELSQYKDSGQAARTQTSGGQPANCQASGQPASPTGPLSHRSASWSPTVRRTSRSSQNVSVVSEESSWSSSSHSASSSLSQGKRFHSGHAEYPAAAGSPRFPAPVTSLPERLPSRGYDDYSVRSCHSLPSPRMMHQDMRVQPSRDSGVMPLHLCPAEMPVVSPTRYPMDFRDHCFGRQFYPTACSVDSGRDAAVRREEPPSLDESLYRTQSLESAHLNPYHDMRRPLARHSNTPLWQEGSEWQHADMPMDEQNDLSPGFEEEASMTTPAEDLEPTLAGHQPHSCAEVSQELAEPQKEQESFSEVSNNEAQELAEPRQERHSSPAEHTEHSETFAAQELRSSTQAHHETSSPSTTPKLLNLTEAAVERQDFVDPNESEAEILDLTDE